MRFAILCPGPSLARHDARAWAGHVVIGVNAAATRHCVHYWAALDAATRNRREDASAPGDGGQTWGEMVLALSGPRPLMLLPADADIVEGEGDRRFPIQRTSAIATAGLPERWCDYSATAAVVWAAALGATEIVMFGADMAGSADFRGEVGENRDEQRWREEGALLERIIAWLGRRGIAFRRIQ